MLTSLRQAILLGLVVWFVPFVVAFCIFPLKETWRSLFESIMPVTLAAVVTVGGLLYLRKLPSPSVREGLLLGLIWLTISLAIDLPLMLSPPIRMSPLEYMADIGLTYLMTPIITAGLAIARRGPTA
jgi:hypothetical protein